MITSLGRGLAAIAAAGFAVLAYVYSRFQMFGR